jgi:hypothetical protein
MDTIKQMPMDARVWVYQSNSRLSEEEIQAIKIKGAAFIESWAAHGAALKASFDILHNRFIILAVDEKQAQASGCSIDKSVGFMKALEQEFNLQLFDRMQVAYRTQQDIEVCTLSEFEKLAKQGIVTPSTVVFNNMITTKAAFDSAWEVPLKESWQKKVLSLFALSSADPVFFHPSVLAKCLNTCSNTPSSGGASLLFFTVFVFPSFVNVMMRIGKSGASPMYSLFNLVKFALSIASINFEYSSLEIALE